MCLHRACTCASIREGLGKLRRDTVSLVLAPRSACASSSHLVPGSASHPLAAHSWINLPRASFWSSLSLLKEHGWLLSHSGKSPDILAPEFRLTLTCSQVVQLGHCVTQHKGPGASSHTGFLPQIPHFGGTAVGCGSSGLAPLEPSCTVRNHPSCCHTEQRWPSSPQQPS